MKVEGWNTTEVQNLASQARHSFIDGDWIEAPYITDVGVRLIQTGNIGIGVFVDKNKKFISEVSFTELKCKDVYAGDILICRLADPIGRSCVVPNLNSRAITSVDVCILRVEKGKYDRDYIAHALNQKTFLDACQEHSGGSTRQRISRTNLGKLKLLVPQSKPEQTKIAEILSTVDQAIEQTEALIAKQQRIKTGLMQDLLTRGIDEHGNLRSEQTHQFKDSPLGRIPVEWEVKKISEVATKVTDGDHHTPQRSVGGFYLLSARNINDGYIDLSDVDYVPTAEYRRMLRRCNPEAGDILVSCSGTIGRVCEVPEWLKCVLVRSAALIKFNRAAIISRFAEWTMRSSVVQCQMLAAQRQAAQPNLFQGEIENLQLPIPQTEEQQRIADFLDSAQADINRSQMTLKKLRSLKTALMQDLLTGKKRVTALLKDKEVVGR